MNIPNDGGWGKSEGREGQAPGRLLGHISSISRDWVILACLILTATLCFGLGLLANRQSQPFKDPLWIEQLPVSELPGSMSTSTVVGQESQPATAPASSETSQPAAATAALPATKQSGQYVASKTGTKYYLPSCSGANRIKDENKLWFATKQQAEAAGYSPSSTCKGL